MSIDFWKWRFLNNPFAPDKFISLHWDDEKLVGHYAASPVELIINNEIVKSALSMTTMTDPLYQGLGIFPSLANRVFKELTESKYSNIFGFPNNNSHFGLINGLGWKDISTIPFLSLDYKGISQFKARNIDFVSHVNFDSFDNNLFFNTSKCVQINKSIAYLNWRYTQNPINSYRIHEFEGTVLVYKVIPSFDSNGNYEVDIVEMSNNLKYVTLRKHIDIILKQECNISRINIWKTLFQEDYKSFERIGFRPSMPLTYFCFKGFDSACDSITDLRNWDLSLGYSDVF